MYKKFVELAKLTKAINPVKQINLIMNPATYEKCSKILLKDYPNIKVETSIYMPEGFVIEKPDLELKPERIDEQVHYRCIQEITIDGEKIKREKETT